MTDEREFEPDFTSERPGESTEFRENNLDHFYLGKRRFDVEIEEHANGVWHATTEVVRSGQNGRLYHRDHGPFPFRPDEVWAESESEATPSEAFGVLQGAVEKSDEEERTGSDDSDE